MRSNIQTLGKRGVICGMVAGLALLCVAPGRAQTNSEKTPPKSGTHATTGEMPVVDLAGYQRLVAKYKGKPLLVTFWATWCEPCEAEYPLLVDLAAKYAPQGLATFGLNMDDDSDLNVARHFLAKNKPGFPNFRQKPGIDLDAFYHGVNPAWTGSMPETIFYNRDGSIAGHFIGLQPREIYEQAIRTILASPATTAQRAAIQSNSRGR